MGQPDPKMMEQMRAAMKNMKGPLPGMDALAVSTIRETSP